MRALWKGIVNFGLVNIPVALHPATRPNKQVQLRLLRRKDGSPIHYKRVADTDGTEVEWAEIARGYEYEKDKFVLIDETDFEKVRLESDHTVHIQEFVRLDKIDPMFFDQPYYLVPEKNGQKAYALLRDALKNSGKVGIAKVVLRPPREHLAAVKPLGNALVLELMHFPDELISPEELKLPGTSEITGKALAAAEGLIQTMYRDWEPGNYRDEYREGLQKIIEQKVAGKETAPAKRKKKEPTKTIDLLAVLEESLQQVKSRR